MKKLSVTIGIPAYNEEANIGKLISCLLKQNNTGFKLNKIIVISDQSTDKTDEIVRGFRNSKVLLKRNDTRLGQALSQNVLAESSESDILVLMNADMYTYDDSFISKLVAPFHNGKTNVGIVCPQLKTLPAQNYFESVINFSVSFKDSIFKRLRNGNNMYTCRGACRAFSKEFYKNFEWPKLTAEDTYTYLTCIKEGFSYRFCDNAVLWYRSPSEFKDHLRQSKRFSSHKNDLKRFFGKDFVNKEYFLPFDLIVYSILLSFLRHPLLMISYMFILFYVSLTPYHQEGHIWNPSYSTKRLI